MMLSKSEAHKLKMIMINRELTNKELADATGLVSAEITQLLIPLPTKEDVFNTVCAYLSIDCKTLDKT